MARVRIAHRSDPARMARTGEPVANRRADRAAHMRPLGFGARGLAGDKQQDPVALRYRLLQPSIQPVIGRGQAVPMQVDRAFGRDESPRELTIPGAI